MKNTIMNPQILIVFVFGGIFVLCGGQEDLSIAPMEKKEQEALYSTIQGFIGKWWNGSDLYPDPCGWTPIQGVSCDMFNGFWYVTGMNIGPVFDNSLRCTTNANFTHHLFDLKHLKSLSFFNCFFSLLRNPIQIPSSNWENLANTLESLEFRSNRGLVGTIPTSLGCLKKLQSLVILENGLTGRLPIQLGNLIKLKRLVLAGNKFTGQIPVSFGMLNELLILDISRNHLSGSILPLTLGGLTSLLKLDLSNNRLDGKLPKELGNLKNLTLLDLRSNKFSGELTQSLQEMVSLKEMVISHNPIGGNLTGIQWEKLQNLEILDLSDMGLTGTMPESVTVLRRLRFLGLSDNKITGRVSTEFASMTSLSSLYINGNNLTGKLQLSDWFYKKMGRRFGAWNNPNLCYKVELISTSEYVPFGVKPCETKKRL